MTDDVLVRGVVPPDADDSPEPADDVVNEPPPPDKESLDA